MTPKGSKKRTLTESAPAPEPTRKAAKATEQEPEQDAEKAHEEEHQKKHEEIESKQPHDYICIDAPYWCTSKDDDDDESEEDEGDKEKDKDDVFPKPAEDHPNHKWVMLWQSWTMLTDWMQKADYTDPDLFDMYVYNDFHGYGLVELLENLLADFDKVKTKHTKAKDTASLLDMWAPLATLAHWINTMDATSFMMIDDGERASKLVGLVGSAMMTMLHTLDSDGELKADGAIKDLGLVISLYLKWSVGQDRADYGIEEEELEWRPLLLTYAKKAGIDLVAVGCSGTAEAFEDVEEGSQDDLKKVDKQFSWTKTSREYKKHHCAGNELGGERYNIMKMSRKQRAEYAFDKKDPLARFSEKDIKEGNLAIG